uniref:hypothetical protein n=1 Tax=Burkholderia diffusa TaxID=488732 RepID=UPI001CC3902A
MKITDDMLTEWFPRAVDSKYAGIFVANKFQHSDLLYWRYWDGNEWWAGVSFEPQLPETSCLRNIRVEWIQVDMYCGLKEKHHG